MKPALFAFALLILQTPQTAPATIEGFVVELGAVQVLAGARVVLNPAGAGGNAVATTTDAVGRFIFSNVEPGTYRLSASRNGYVRTEYDQPVTVAVRQEVKDIVVKMMLAGVISGRVYDRDGDPVTNANVYALKYDYEDGRRLLILVQNVKTNDLGEYRLQGIQPGQYVVSAVPTTGARTYLPVYFPGTTDSTAATRIDILPGATLGRVDFPVAETPTVRIRGEVVNGLTGKPPVSITVILFPRRPAIAAAITPRSTNTKVGAFELGDIAPGSYDLVAAVIEPGSLALPPSTNPDTVLPAYVRLSGHVPLEVGNADIENVSLILQPGITISGRINLDTVSAGGRLPSNAQVTLRPEPRIPHLFPPVARIMADGSFTVYGILPGIYQVAVTSMSQRWYTKAATFGAADVLNSGLRIQGPTQNSLEILVSDNSGLLTGVVLDERQQPASRVTVVLIPEPPQRDSFDLYWPVTSDAAGHFRMDGIVPGNYKVFAWESVQGSAWQDLEFVRPYEHLGKTIRIGEGASENIDIKLISTP